MNLAAAVTQIMLFIDVTLNTGTATYYVSTDDGANWTAVTDLSRLVNVPSGTQIRIRVNLTGNAELDFWGIAA